MKRNLPWNAAVVAFISAVGCGEGLVNVRAKVTLDGKPLDNASVSLVSSGEIPNPTAIGFTDAEGITRFTTFEPNDGVMPGNYKVVVVKSPGSREEEMKKLDLSKPEDLQRFQMLETRGNVPFTRTALPRVYLNPQQTPLSCTVESGSAELTLNLDSSLGNGTPKG